VCLFGLWRYIAVSFIGGRNRSTRIAVIQWVCDLCPICIIVSRITALCASTSLTPYLIHFLDGYARSNIFWFLILYSYYRKTFTVWMLFCRSTFNKMFNTKSMVYFWYIVLPSYKVQPFFFWSLVLFSLLGRGENSTSAIYPYFPLFLRRNYIPCNGNTTIRLNGFQMGSFLLWSSIVGYWAKSTFLYF
jgi:hypothetical protein